MTKVQIAPQFHIKQRVRSRGALRKPQPPPLVSLVGNHDSVFGSRAGNVKASRNSRRVRSSNHEMHHLTIYEEKEGLWWLHLCGGLRDLFHPALQPGLVGAQLAPVAGQQGLEQRDELQVALGGGVVVPAGHLQIPADRRGKLSNIKQDIKHGIPLPGCSFINHHEKWWGGE